MNTTNRVDINQVLMQMRAMKAQAGATPENQAVSAAETQGLATQQPRKAEAPSFGEMLNTAVNTVNNLQHDSGRLQKAYVEGDPEVTLTQVMVSSQKAGVAFQAMTQVRNKLISAYEDIKNMPI